MDIEIDREALAAFERLQHTRRQRAVAPVAMDPSPFQKFIRRDLRVELRRREKMIMHAIHFARPRRTRGRGDDALKTRFFLDDTFAQRAFA